MLRFIIRKCLHTLGLCFYYVMFAFNMSFTLRRCDPKIHLHSVYLQSVIMTVLYTEWSVILVAFAMQLYTMAKNTYVNIYTKLIRTGTTYDGSIPHIYICAVYRIIEERAIIYIAIIKQTTHFSPFLKGEHCIWLWWNSVGDRWGFI